MAYIVPREIPKSCHECQFHYCTEYHPFWSGDKEKRNTQTIRCQAITPFRSTVLDIKDETFKADWCPLVDVTDVAPKSEVAREIFAEIDKVRVRYVIGTINKRELNEMLCYLKEKYTEGET